MVKKKAITLVEIIFASMILSLIMIVLFGTITKKVVFLADTSSGTLYCFKDSKGNLNQYITLKDGTETKQENVAKCSFKFPDAVMNYSITLIGGGGGGAQAGADNPFEEVINDKNYKIFDSPFKGKMTDNVPLYINIAGQDYEGNEALSYLNSNGFDVISKSTSYSFLSNSLAEYITDDFFSLAHKNSAFYLEGGNDNGVQGAKCVFGLNNITNPANFKYTYTSGFDASNNVTGNFAYIPAQAGVFKLYNGSTLVAEAVAQAPVNSVSKSNSKYNTANPSCVVKTGASYIKVLSSSPDELSLDKPVEIYTTKISSFPKYKMWSGNGGSKGAEATITRNLSGKNVVIEKSSIGDPGQGGTANNPEGANGGATTFDDVTVSGGSGGQKAETVIQISKDMTNAKISASNIGNADNNKKRLLYQGKNAPSIEAQKTAYVNTNMAQLGLTPDLINKAGTCNSASKSCENGTINQYVMNFGAGGAGSSVLAGVPYIEYMEVKPSSMYSTILNKESSYIKPEVKTTQAGNGSGGAIIIKW